jgi:CRP-like cAMP-binding protein
MNSTDSLPLYMEKARNALKSVKHIADLPEHVLNDIAHFSRLRYYKAGQVIYLEGEQAETLYLLESGWVKATRMSPDGREQALLFLKPGEIFGDISVLTDTPYPGTVTALEEVAVWTIDKSSLLKLINRHPNLAMAVIRRLGERVMYFIGLIEDLSLRSVEARIANTLLKHAHIKGTQLIVPRRSWTTFDMMATRLGTVRDVLRRALRNLEDEGLLKVEKQAIIILDREGLERRGNT